MESTIASAQDPQPQGFALPIRFSIHAVQRYRERVKPTLTRHQAHQDLLHVASFGHLRERPPAWLRSPRHQGAPLYLTIEEIVLTLRTGEHPLELVATTCMVKASWGRRPKQGRRGGRTSRHAKRRSGALRRARRAGVRRG